MAVPVGIPPPSSSSSARAVANALRSAADVLAGVPSIAVGAFAVAVLSSDPFDHYSGLVGSFALATLMLPIVIHANEAAMRSVPRDLWEAGLALGVRRSRVVRSVVLRGALPGSSTGNLLAVSAPWARRRPCCSPSSAASSS